MENHIPPASQISLETAFPGAEVSCETGPPRFCHRPEHCSSLSCELVQARQGPVPTEQSPPGLLYHYAP